jgi:hypothetical protein
MDYVIPLIDEAWDHHRRRHRRVYLAAAALLALAALVAAVAPGTSRTGLKGSPNVGVSVPKGTVRVSPSAAFSQAPYMGVNCPVANSIRCDQVGLAVWLRHPAYSVDASIAGAFVRLNWFGDEYRLGHLARPRRAFDGYLRPAGIVSRLHVRPVGGSMWYGDDTPSPTVWVLINYGADRHALTRLQVPLMAGWG